MTQPNIAALMALAKRMMRDSWADGGDASWMPAHDALETAARELAGGAEQAVPYAYIYEWDGPFGVHQSTRSARYNGMAPARSIPVYLAAHSPSAVQPTNSVRIPTTADEATLMTLLGMDWLKRHAPERLKASAVQPTEAVQPDLHIAYMAGFADGKKSKAVQPTVEQAITQLVSALVESKGWTHGYADSIVRDAIDRRAVQPLSEAPTSVTSCQISQPTAETSSLKP